jgi:hypothetical protein
MTAQYNVAGAAAISLGLYGGSLTAFGYAIDGVTITENRIHHEIPVDFEGGEGSAPGEQQILNEIHTIRMEMSFFDPTVAAAIRGWGGTAGVVPVAGTLLNSNTLYSRVLINAPNDVRNYALCHFKEPVEQNRGTKYSKLVIVATAYRNQSTRVLWNTTTS